MRRGGRGTRGTRDLRCVGVWALFFARFCLGPSLADLIAGAAGGRPARALACVFERAFMLNCFFFLQDGARAAPRSLRVNDRLLRAGHSIVNMPAHGFNCLFAATLYGMECMGLEVPYASAADLRVAALEQLLTREDLYSYCPGAHVGNDARGAVRWHVWSVAGQLGLLLRFLHS